MRVRLHYKQTCYEEEATTLWGRPYLDRFGANQNDSPQVRIEYQHRRYPAGAEGSRRQNGEDQ